MPSAIQVMRHDMLIKQIRLSNCVNEHGFVKAECRYEYQDLVEEIKNLKWSIEYLEEMYAQRQNSPINRLS